MAKRKDIEGKRLQKVTLPKGAVQLPEPPQDRDRR
jgi:hypothetical protein